jgi:hypothetical protein
MSGSDAVSQKAWLKHQAASAIIWLVVLSITMGVAKY